MDEIAAKLKEFLKRLSDEGPNVAVDTTLERIGPERARLLRLCAIPHQFDPVILKVLEPSLEVEEGKQICQCISDLSFVSFSPDELLLHDKVRRYLFNQWLLPALAYQFAQASERLFLHFDRLASEAEYDEAETARLRRVFHHIGFNRAEGFREFERLFSSYRFDFNLSKCEQLIKLVKEYEPVLEEDYRHRLTYQEGKLSTDRHNLEQAEAIFEELLRHAELNAELRAKTYNRLGMVYASKGAWLKARNCYREAYAMAHQVNFEQSFMALIAHDLGVTYRETGDLDEAEALLKSSAEQARWAGDNWMLAASYNSLGTLYRQEGEFQSAKEYYELSLNCLREQGDKFRIAQLYNNLGIAYLDSRQWKLSEQYFNQSLDIKREVGDFIGEAKTLNNLTRLYLSAGDYERAIDTVRQAINKFEKAHDSRSMADAQWNLGKLYRRLGRKAESLIAFEGAARLFERDELPQLAQDVRREMARV
jgi:tetratricopeptide (TPR) repeat protein